MAEPAPISKDMAGPAHTGKDMTGPAPTSKDMIYASLHMHASYPLNIVHMGVYCTYF
jgi:hypothetical protein